MTRLRMFKPAVLAFLMALLLAPGVSEAACKVPTPDDMKITALAADVPEEYRQFSGIWKDGKWDGKLCHLLAVETIDAQGNAWFVYSYGTFARWRIYEPGYSRNIGKISDGNLKATLGNGAKVTYWLKDSNTLSGKYVRRGNRSYVDLKKATVQ